MRVLMISLFLVLLGGPLSAGEDGWFFALKKEAGGFAVERIPMRDGETKAFSCTPGQGFLDVIFPPACGGSASLAKLSEERLVSVQYAKGTLQVSEKGSGGQVYVRPERKFDDLKLCNIRVCVTGPDGKGQAFIISGYEEAYEDKIAPVVDMFAGKIPLGENDYIVCTDTSQKEQGPPVYGEAPLEHDRHLFVRGSTPGGGEGWFVLDTGGGLTVVAKSFLPKGTSIEKASMVQYSAAGKELLKYEPGGATGSVQTVLGHAQLGGLQFGSLKFEKVSVTVMEEMPDLFGRPVVGILGIDLLRKAEAVSIRLGGGRDGKDKLTLAKTFSTSPERIVEVPFSTVNNHLVIRGQVNHEPVAFILDTGASALFLDAKTAKACGVQVQDQEMSTAKGLDKGTAQIAKATAKNVTIGKRVFDDVEHFVGDLPVFAPLRVHGQRIGLLGNGTFSKFDCLEIDFEKRVIRFVQ